MPDTGLKDAIKSTVYVQCCLILPATRHAPPGILEPWTSSTAVVGPLKENLFNYQ